MEKENKYNLGDRVTVNKKYRRQITGDRKKWIQTQFNCTGFLIGYRTLSNGRTENDGFQRYWVAEEYIKVALIVYSLNNNPVYVPLDSINSQ